MHEIAGQVHWHEPSGFKRAGFGKLGRPKTPYDLFMESDGIPIYRDIGVSKVQNLPLLPWPRMGGRGSYIQLHGTEGKWGCYVVEVPAAGALNIEKHLYEEIYLVVEGRGSTEVWLEGDNKRHAFEWQKGSLFSIPVNAMHRIVNASSAPALLLAGTTAPNLMNLVNDVGAIFNCPYQFRDRFSGADDFYKYKDDIEPDPVRGLAMRRTNFIPDIVNCDLHQGQGLHLYLAGAARLDAVERRQDGRSQTRRLRAGRHGVGGTRRRALVSPAFRRFEGSIPPHRLVRAAQSWPRARPARREAHRLHGDGHSRRR